MVVSKQNHDCVTSAEKVKKHYLQNLNKKTAYANYVNVVKRGVQFSRLSPARNKISIM
jgi:hypothetical protein